MIKRIIFLCIWPLVMIAAPQAPFQRGVNLTQWFQKSSAQQIQFTQYTRHSLEQIRSLGCDHIRLPIDMHAMSGSSPDYTVDPLLFYFLDQVVDWAEELNLHLILDNHSFDPSIPTSPTVISRLKAVWQQFALHYKNRSDLIYYEVLNEPHGIDNGTWNSMQQIVVSAIRAIDTTHTIVIGPADFNSYYSLNQMPVYPDKKLIYTFHFYDPFIFTHQGASWSDPPVDIAGVPFPYDAELMPPKPSSFAGTWLSGAYDSYHIDGTESHVKSLLDMAASFAEERQIPVWCGEFGAFQPNSNTANRARWLNTVRPYLEEKQIAWSMWEYASGFGMFEPGSEEMFDYDLDIPVVEALGLQVPEQHEYILYPDSTGFTLYKDYVGENLLEETWIPSGTMEFYSSESPAEGLFCLYWAGVPQYSHIALKFTPVKDLSLLANEGYVLDFRVRSTALNAKLDLRFIDTKTGVIGDHPWRIRHILDEGVCEWNGTWQHVVLPLYSFSEGGSWDDDKWYNAQGDFDWKAVEWFEIVAEHHDLTGMEFYFDDIRIVHPDQVNIQDETIAPGDFRLWQNYPNPFNPSTTIRYQLPHAGHITLKVFNYLGQELAVLVDEQQSAGDHFVKFSMESFATLSAGQSSGAANRPLPLSSGLYIYRITMDGNTQTRKMILIR